MLNNKIIAVCLGFILLTGSAVGEEADWSLYKKVLNHVKPGTKNGVSLMLVDYAAIKADDSLANAYQALSAFNPKRLSTPQEKLAFYINAYNILALKTIADHWPLESIKDVGSLFTPVWDKPVGQLGGITVTLGELEHKILRPMGEPRIHFAIVCASVSCPDLRNEPYMAADLDTQLDEQTQRFLDNPRKGLIVDKKSIKVSKIFDWFEEDFKKQGEIGGFIKRYRPDLPGLAIKTDLAYDWAVNSKK